MATYTGTSGNNTINGSNGDDVIHGLAGDDTLNGGNGNDTVNGGDDEDVIDGGNGNDTLSGGNHDDVVEGGNGNDLIAGDGGNDLLSGENGNDTIAGGAGNDNLNGGNGSDQLTGGGGDDVIDGGNGSDTAYYSGPISQYSFFSAGGYLHVVHLGGAGADGHDQVRNVERLVFLDRVIDLSGGDNAPVPGDDHVFINEDTGTYSSGSASVLDNDFDFEGDSMTVTPGVFTGDYGTLTLNADGTYSYTLFASAQSLAQGDIVEDDFDYVVSDGSNSDVGTLTFHIAGLNDAPVANPDSASGHENQVLTIDVIANDSDIDNGAVLTVTAASAPPGQGSASIVGNQVQFDPDSDFDHLAVGDSASVTVSYTIQDEHGASASSTVAITVTGTNDGPVANPDTATTSENAAVLVDVLANDDDADDGAVLTVTAASALPGQGSASVVANQVQFDPGADFDHLNVGDSAVVVVSYTIEDEHGASASSTISITITGTNDGPVANPDVAGTSENATVLVDVLANDDDADDGAVLTVTAASAPAGQGTASVVSNQVQFDPGADFDHLNVGDSQVVVVSYTIEDEHGASAASTISITVTGTNDGPVANPDAATTSENAAVLVDVLANDDDADDGAVLTVTAASAPPGQGSASVVANQVQFDPGSDFDNLNVGDSAVVMVSYTIEDEHGASASSTISITVTGTNDGPVANPDVASTSENATVLVDVLANDDDVDDGAVLTVTAASAPPGQGSASIVANQVQFDPGTDFDYLADGESTVVLLNYSIQDEHGASASSTVSVTVTGTNDAPTIEAGGTDASGAVTELPNNDPNENAFTHQDSGTIAFDDLDLSDAHSASFVAQGGSYLGTFSLDPVNQAGDSVGWDFSVSDADLDSLEDGEVVTQTYTVEIDDGHGGTVTQDVTITITGAADNVPPDGTNWYIDNSAVGSANTGSPTDPFTSIAAFNAAQGAPGGPGVGDNVFLLAGIGTYAEADGINLLDGQVLTGVAAGPLRPTIVASAGDGINVAQNNSIAGVDIGDTSGAGIADSGGSVGTLTISDVAKSGGGQIADLDQGGTLNVTLNSAASTGSTGGAIDLAGVGGSFTVAGATTIAGTHSGGGVVVSGSAANVTLSGGGSIATGSANAVDYLGNSGSLAIGGGLDIVTTGGAGLTASGGGSVTMVGAGSSIVTASGTAVTIAGTTIGAAGVTLESVSTNGAASGIVLANTGAGAFSVTGTGVAGSGGAILASTGVGVSLTNTGPVSLADFAVTGGGDDGVRGASVDGLSLLRVNVSGNGNLAGEHNMDFTELTGIVSIASSTFTGGGVDNIHIANTSGTLDLTMTGTTIGGSTHAIANDGLIIEANGTSTVRMSVTGSTFTDNRGDHFQFLTNAAATSTSHVTFNNNVLTTTSAAVTGGGIAVSTTGAADLFLAIELNSIQGARSTAIVASMNSSTAAGEMHATIVGNTIGTTGVAGSGSQTGNGMNVTLNGHGTMTALIEGNDVRNWSQIGINVLARDGTGTLNATIDGNAVLEQGTFGLNSIRVEAGAVSTDSNQLWLEMNDNIANTALAQDIRVRPRFNADILMPGYVGAANDTVAVDAFLTAANPFGGDVIALFNANAVSGYFDTPGSAAVPLPIYPDTPLV